MPATNAFDRPTLSTQDNRKRRQPVSKLKENPLPAVRLVTTKIPGAGRRLAESFSASNQEAAKW
jgi:hypothetical protein